MSGERIDGVLVEWGERLFYPANRIVRSHTPRLDLPERAMFVRQRIHATVVRRAPQVMVKVTGGGRGMAAIAAHLRYISKSGRLPFEDERRTEHQGPEDLRDVIEQWRWSGSRIPEQSHRREAVNIMLSMPRGTNPEFVRDAARGFARDELSNHRWVMVLHTHQANPHVHLAVRAEGMDGTRLNPRKADLRRWREVFAERLRFFGIEAEATSQQVRGGHRHNERVRERHAGGATRAAGRSERDGAAKLTPSRHRAAKAWCEIAKALASSDDIEDRKLADAVVQFAGRLPGVRLVPKEKQAQRELPGWEQVLQQQRTRPGPEWAR